MMTRFGLSLPPQMRVFGAFFVYSFCMGSIFPRLPDMQAQMGVTAAGLGLGLIGAPVGTLISLTLAAPLLERLGYRRAILMLIPLLSVFYALSTISTSPTMFFVLLLPVGLCIGCIEIIINLEADRTEHLLGRRIMNRSHAFWSIGFFSAGLIGAYIAQLGISPTLHLAAMIPVVTVATLVWLGRFDPAPHRGGTSTAAAPRFAAPTLAIGVLVAVTLSAMVMEGAAMDWSAIYMDKIFRATPFLAGFAVAVAAFSQGATRFFIDSFVERYSPVDVARILLVILGLGALLVFFAAADWQALLGFGLIGIGTSAIFPLAMSAAAQRTDRPSAINVAALAQISFVAFLLGPPLLGFVADHFGHRWIYGIGLPLVALSLAAAPALGRKPIPQTVDQTI
ncbi:MAG TPA: MFS transporter [Devosiaceae bacterium]|jgi:MFS family permease